MKLKNIGKIVALGLCVPLFSGCSGANFFNIESTMSPPEISKTYKEIDKVVSDYIGPNLIWKYAKFNGGYAKIIKCQINDENIIYLIFCQRSDESQKIHVLFLQEKNSKWTILKDDTQNIFDVKNVDLEDVDSDGNKEIIIRDQILENNYCYECAYKYKNGQIINIKK